MDPITIASALASAGGELSSTATLILTAAKWIYQRITDKSPQPIKNIKDTPHLQDRTRYERLCNLNRKPSYS